MQSKTILFFLAISVVLIGAYSPPPTVTLTSVPQGGEASAAGLSTISAGE